MINDSFCETVHCGEHVFEIIGCSAKGSEDKVNQDSYGYFSDDDCIIIAVADGLGSAPLSQIGSKHVIQSVIETLRDPISDCIWERISESWRSSLDGPAEDYDTTCKFACIRKDKVILGSIGDGWLGVKNTDGYFELDNQKEFTNITKSMCSKNMLEETILIECSIDELVSFGLSTDGFSEDMDSESRETFLTDAGCSLSECPLNTFEEIQHVLENWPIKSNKDDKTLILTRRVE